MSDPPRPTVIPFPGRRRLPPLPLEAPYCEPSATRPPSWLDWAVYWGVIALGLAASLTVIVWVLAPALSAGLEPVSASASAHDSLPSSW